MEDETLFLKFFGTKKPRAKMYRLNKRNPIVGQNPHFLILI